MTTAADLREVAGALVRMCSAGEDEAFVERYYADDIVSLEGAGIEGLPARLEGIEAVRGKHAWWNENHEVHAVDVEGPFIGGAADRFAVRFEVDVTPKGRERTRMTELALYTVRDGRIAEEEFLYLEEAAR